MLVLDGKWLPQAITSLDRYPFPQDFVKLDDISLSSDTKGMGTQQQFSDYDHITSFFPSRSISVDSPMKLAA